MEYDDENDAVVAADMFNRGELKVLGQQVHAGAPEFVVYDPQHWTWDHQNWFSVITISGILGEATDRDVVNYYLIDRFPRLPFFLLLGASRADSENYPENEFQSVQRLLTSIGPLHMWRQHACGGPAEPFKATTKFVSDEAGLRAIRVLSNRPLPFDGGNNLRLRPVPSISAKVPTSIYNAVLGEITIPQDDSWEKRLYLGAYHLSTGQTVLRIDGVDIKDVLNAKAALKTILDGHLLTHNGLTVWTPSFTFGGDVYSQLRSIERRTGALIVCDTIKTQLRLLGPPEQRQQAAEALVKLVEADLWATHTIELDMYQTIRLHNGGLEAINATTFHGNILDLNMDDKVLTLRGPEADHRLAQDILDGREPCAHWAPGASNQCTICLTEADRPVLTLCNNVYCAGCFQNMCANSAKSGRPIRCEGDQSNCGTVILQEELVELLSGVALESILASAFASHILQHPELRCCPTADCDQTYRATAPNEDGSDSPVFSCTGCLENVCTSCHVPHDEISCVQQRDLAAGGYEALRRLKEEVGMKDCPKCGATIEKAEGCDHIGCVCGAHICWQCLQVFGSPHDTYMHMRQEHGFAYHPELVNQQ